MGMVSMHLRPDDLRPDTRTGARATMSEHPDDAAGDFSGDCWHCEGTGREVTA